MMKEPYYATVECRTCKQGKNSCLRHLSRVRSTAVERRLSGPGDDCHRRSKFSLRCVLSVGLSLFTLVILISVVVWAVSADAVMGAFRASALRSSDVTPDYEYDSGDSFTDSTKTTSNGRDVSSTELTLAEGTLSTSPPSEVASIENEVETRYEGSTGPRIIVLARLADEKTVNLSINGTSTTEAETKATAAGSLSASESTTTSEPVTLFTSSKLSDSKSLKMHSPSPRKEATTETASVANSTGERVIKAILSRDADTLMAAAHMLAARHRIVTTVPPHDLPDGRRERQRYEVSGHHQLNSLALNAVNYHRVHRPVPQIFPGPLIARPSPPIIRPNPALRFTHMPLASNLMITNLAASPTSSHPKAHEVPPVIPETPPSPPDRGSSNSNAMVSMHADDPQTVESKGLTLHFGGGPEAGSSQLTTSPVGIFKSMLPSLFPKPRLNLNGKVVFGVVLDSDVNKHVKPIHRV